MGRVTCTVVGSLATTLITEPNSVGQKHIDLYSVPVMMELSTHEING